jgi:ribonuclease HI
MDIKIFTDGAARGNPGPAGIGIVICGDNNKVLEKHHHYLGTATNNEAEYLALIKALTIAKKYTPCAVSVFMDSELVVRQMLGIYRVRNKNLLEHYLSAQELCRVFYKVGFEHIPREKNKPADLLANMAIDAALKA